MDGEELELTRPDPQDVRSSIKDVARAAREAVNSGAIPRNMGEPAIGTAAGVPRVGAAANAGDPAAAPAPAGTVTLLEDEELPPAEGGEAPPPREGEQPPAEGGEEAPPQEGEQPPAGEGDAGEEGEFITVELPPVREGQEAALFDVEDQETADRLRALARGALRRDELSRERQALEREREEGAQLSDVLELNPVGYIVDHIVDENRQIDVARHLMSLPHVYNAVMEEVGQLDAEALETRRIKMENQRLTGQSNVTATLRERADSREQSRIVRGAIARAVPEEMSAGQADILRRDLLRDVTDYVHEHHVRSLRIDELVPILESRLALYGVDVGEATERMQDTTIVPLTRGGKQAPSAPARPPVGKPARTGEQLRAQAEARRRAGTVPGGGAGVPAAGIVLPRKQRLKERFASLREMVGLK